MQAPSDYVYQVEDLRNGTVENIYGNRLKFYRDASVETEAIMSHVLSSETGMPVTKLLETELKKQKLFVLVLWKGLLHSKEIIELLCCIYDVVPGLVRKLLRRKNSSPTLVTKALKELCL